MTHTMGNTTTKVGGLYRVALKCPTGCGATASYLRTGVMPVLLRCPNCKTPEGVQEHISRRDL